MQRKVLYCKMQENLIKVKNGGIINMTLNQIDTFNGKPLFRFNISSNVKGLNIR